MYKSISIIALFVLLSSCGKNEEFEFMIVNNTSYHIDEFQFDENNYEIFPNESSSAFKQTVTTRYGGLSSAPASYLAVKQFSDSSGNYDHFTGIDIKAYDFSGDLNIIEISLTNNQEFPDHVFEIKLNN
ncbi:MAG: hypothetical protein MRY83_01645 [Flavobacteriales bacterium]|nr:hypothetical protein [Flavobacteriales bacterium]